MNRPRYMPPDAYWDDPAEKIDPPERDPRDLAYDMASVLHARINEWITAGRGWVKHRALRSDIALICVSPHLFECKRPCAAWCARQHGVSREYAARLCREFAAKFGDYIQFRGQRFLNQKRRGRGRQGPEGPQPGPVAGA
jgi:hypothetical protein